MQLLRYIFKFFSWIVIAAIVIFLAIAAPLIAGFHPMVVLTGSMEPAYPVGCVAYYKACDFNELKGGDAITFEAGDDGMVTHRIASIDPVAQTVITKGDANETQDPTPVDSSRIKGKTANIRIPYAGFFVQKCKSVPVLIIAALILLLDYVLASLAPKKPKKKKNED